MAILAATSTTIVEPSTPIQALKMNDTNGTFLFEVSSDPGIISDVKKEDQYQM